MVPDWKALLPHRPLDPETDQYAVPPSSGGERIARWILADRTTVLVAGPVGIGKSTELARATKLLENDRLPFLIRLDRFENMKRVSVDQILLRIAGQMVMTAMVDLELSISQPLRASLAGAGVIDESRLSRAALNAANVLFGAAFELNPPAKFEASAPSLLRLAIAEVSRLAPRRVVILVDGLEKLPDGKIVDEVFEALGMLSDDVDLVAVLPWTLAFGPGPEMMLRTGEHIVVLRAVEIRGNGGQKFMLELLARRLGAARDALALPEQAESRDVIERAAIYSGGVPRTFLQLVADAGTYARMRHKSPWPDLRDLADAVADQEDSFRRILRRGDNDAVLSADGNDGRELDLERKVRLLAHGVLLERDGYSGPVLTVHPLVSRLLNLPGANHA